MYDRIAHGSGYRCRLLSVATHTFRLAALRLLAGQVEREQLLEEQPGHDGGRRAPRFQSTLYNRAAVGCLTAEWRKALLSDCVNALLCKTLSLTATEADVARSLDAMRTSYTNDTGSARSQVLFLQAHQL